MPDFKEEVRQLPTLSRAFGFQPGTINEENRTVDVVFGTDAPVLMGWWDKYYEILDFSAAAVDMSRLASGAPVLWMHDRYEQIGVVEKAWVDGSKGYATLRFSKNKDADEIWNDIKDGVVRNISVGYTVQEYTEITKEDNIIPTLRATQWQPAEISVVSVPADHGAGVRSSKDEQKEFSVRVLSIQNNMPNENKENPIPPATPPAANSEGAERKPTAGAEGGSRGAEDTEKVREAARKEERQRGADIKAAVRAAKLDDLVAEDLIERGVSIDVARKEIIEKFAAADSGAGSRSQVVALKGKDENEKKRAGMEAALILRANPAAEKQKIVTAEDVEHAREYRFMTLMDMAKDACERAGVDYKGKDKMEMVRLAITSHSSDFPIALEGTNRRILLAAYNAVPDTWRSICRIGQVSDFREYKRLRMGTFSNLDELLENETYKNKGISDAEYEKISAKTVGNIINISRKMIINDDLSAFADLVAKLGRAAARTIESDVYALFAENSGNGPTMVDGKALFHADHGNIMATSAAPTVASFDAMRTKMKQTKEKDDNDYIDIMPAIWLGPTSLGSTARTVNDAQYDVDVSNKYQVPNKSKGMFGQMIDTPRLSGTAWYGLADPNLEPVFEVVFLDGVQTPYLESQQAFTQDGMQWKIRHDFGVGAIGFRGIQKNAGA